MSILVIPELLPGRIYAPLRSGTDIAFLGGMIKYIIDNEKYHKDYVLAYTNASFLVKDEYGFEDGLFSGYDPEKRSYDVSSWDYQYDENGLPIKIYTAASPLCFPIIEATL